LTHFWRGYIWRWGWSWHWFCSSWSSASLALLWHSKDLKVRSLFSERFVEVNVFFRNFSLSLL